MLTVYGDVLSQAGTGGPPPAEECGACGVQVPRAGVGMNRRRYRRDRSRAAGRHDVQGKPLDTMRLILVAKAFSGANGQQRVTGTR
jgi:hypothetical protein